MGWRARWGGKEMRALAHTLRIAIVIAIAIAIAVVWL